MSPAIFIVLPINILCSAVVVSLFVVAIRERFVLRVVAPLTTIAFMLIPLWFFGWRVMFPGHG